GVVYRAHDPLLNRDLAIKVLPATKSEDPDARAQILHEARSASALNHPNICTIYEVGETDDNIFIAMELIEGEGLDQLIAREQVPLETAIGYAQSIARALEHAHARQVVHRDLKASNVVVGRDGTIKVVDFGLAKKLAADPHEISSETAPLTQ